MIVFYLTVIGIVVGLFFYAYTKTIRTTSRSDGSSDSSSVGMVAGPVNQQRAAGVVPKIIPVNLRTGQEDEQQD